MLTATVSVEPTVKDVLLKDPGSEQSKTVVLNCVMQTCVPSAWTGDMPSNGARSINGISSNIFGFFKYISTVFLGELSPSTCYKSFRVETGRL
jgi:hypothetical protein